jgi:hypothetical protein
LKRLWALRESFKLFDFSDDSTDALKQLLMHTFVSPTFLRLGDGQKFLSFLLEYGDQDLIQSAHQIILNQIPHASKTIVRTFGEIYVRAWRSGEKSGTGGAVNESQIVLEQLCIQDLVNRCIHARRSQGM